MFEDNVIGTTIPHREFGDAGCCGCLIGIVKDSLGNICCNKCGLILRTVSAADLKRTLDEMELSLDFAAVICPHCLSVNLFSGSTAMTAFVCQSCDRFVDNQAPNNDWQ